MELELRDVVEEANALAAGWGQVIFQSASECAHNELVRKKLREVEEGRLEEREGWVRRKESVKEGFLRELDAAAAVPAVEKNEVVAAEKVKTGSSDEEAVMVEKDVAAPVTPGSAKKKKGKK